MCIIISFALVSCSNNTSSENKISSKNNNQIVSEKKTDTVTETSTEPSKDTEKKIKRYIKKSLDKQKETKGKFLGLERLIYLDYPKYKNEDYSVKYNVKVNLVRKGEIRNSIKGENNYE